MDDGNKEKVNMADSGKSSQIVATAESSDSEFVDATQSKQVILEIQAIVEYDKDKLKYFLEKSWANMVYLDDRKNQDEGFSVENDF